MEKAITAALALFLLLFLAYPSVKVKSYEGIKKQELIQVEDIPETHQKKVIQPPPERPSIPVETESEQVPKERTIIETELDTIIRPLPPPAPKSPPFVHYEKKPQLVKSVKPVYPEIARKTGIEGVVILELRIDERGNVVKAKVLKGLGAGCDEAAIAAAMRCKFKPAMQRDKPVPVRVKYSVGFTLKEARSK